jgi:L-lactate permease
MTDEVKPVADWRNDPSLSDTWKFRFDFYDRYGTRSLTSTSDEFKAAFLKLGLSDRIKVNGNLWAFFFGFIYLFILGLWRQAVLVLAAVLVLVVVFFLLYSVFPPLFTDIISRMVGLVFTALVAIRTNTWYYHEKTKGGAGWMI